MKEDIIRMAREAGWSQKDIDSLLYIVETVAAAEREACAVFCDQLSDSSRDLRFGAAIRARGQE
jgi:hypothetical protein